MSFLQDLINYQLNYHLSFYPLISILKISQDLKYGLLKNTKHKTMKCKDKSISCMNHEPKFIYNRLGSKMKKHTKKENTVQK